MPAPTAARRASRLWLYLPFVLLLVAGLAWSAFWVLVRGRVEQAVDGALAREAERGRHWSCADRRIEGFPFRIELRCASLTLTSTRWGDEVRVQSGPLVVLGQIYTPRQVILQATGPLTATLPAGSDAEMGWSRLEASARLTLSGIERVSLAVHDSVTTLRSRDANGSRRTDSVRSALFEAHLRPHPERFGVDGAIDLALSTKGTVMAAFDALLGNDTPSDIDLQTTITRAPAFRAGFNPDTLEAWRGAGGEVELARIALAKGTARLEGSGRFGLDETRRPAGEASLSIAGIDRIAGIRVGGLAAGIGGLFGGGPPAAPGLTRLPSLVLREGRVFVGPLRLPVAPVAPLY